MGRNRTEDLPDLSGLLVPVNPFMLAVEQAVLRNHWPSQVPVSLPEQIAARLAGVITLDLVHAGQRLLEQDISRVLQVSRAPVREALRMLERDRLVEFVPRRGALVTAPSADELRDVYAVRLTLYAMLMRQLMEERPADLEAVFDRFMPEVARAARQSVDAYAVETFLFNFAIADLCSNRLLVDLLQSISLRTLRYVRLGLASSPSGLSRYVKSWRALHAAISDRDTERAVEMVTQRISQVRDAATGYVGRTESTPTPLRPIDESA